MSEPPKTYGEIWDRYVTKSFPKIQRSVTKKHEIEWPGDEWGSPQRWQQTFHTMFVAHLPKDVKLGLEIGSGSGKYSRLFLEHYTGASLVAADVSGAFLQALSERCADLIDVGRLHTGQIYTEHTALSDIAKRAGYGPGTFDVVYSIDAMVHVDLQFLTAYWLSAVELLRPGGKVIMTVADATRDFGFETLLEHVPIYFKHQGRQTTKFEWLCPYLVEYVLGRLGFEVQEVKAPSSKRDYCFVATKI